MNQTRADFFSDCSIITEEDLLKEINSSRITLSKKTKGANKCRLVYDREITNIDFQPYNPRAVRSFKLLETDLDYAYKYDDRSSIDDLYDERGECDDILMIKNGLLSDTSIANVAFLLECVWLTPEVPILPGTMRAKLICERKIQPARLTSSDIANARMAVINAMIGFMVIDCPLFDF